MHIRFDGNGVFDGVLTADAGAEVERLLPGPDALDHEKVSAAGLQAFGDLLLEFALGNDVVALLVAVFFRFVFHAA